MNKLIIAALALSLSACATISQDIVTTKDGITQKCKLDAKGYIGSGESTLACKSYDEQGNYIEGSESITVSKMGY